MTRFAPSATLLPALAATLLAAAASAQQYGPVQGPALPPGPQANEYLRGFEPEDKWKIHVDNTPLKGSELWMAARAGSSLLLKGEGLGEGILIQPRGGKVGRLDPGMIMEELDSTLAVKVVPPPLGVGTFEVEDDGLSFQLDGKTVALKASPDLIGPREGAELLSLKHSYAFRTRAYVPQAGPLASLKTAAQPITVKTFFGSWCSACARKLPRLLRVQKDLGESALKFEYVGVPGQFRKYPPAREFQITGVPTAILLQGDRELGRIKGNAWATPEVALKDLLAKAGVVGAGP